MKRIDIIKKLYSLYTGCTNGLWYLQWLEGQTDLQLDIHYSKAFK